MQGLEPGALNFNDAIVQESLTNQPTPGMLAEVRRAARAAAHAWPGWAACTAAPGGQLWPCTPACTRCDAAAVASTELRPLRRPAAVQVHSIVQEALQEVPTGPDAPSLRMAPLQPGLGGEAVMMSGMESEELSSYLTSGTMGSPGANLTSGAASRKPPVSAP